MIILLHGEDDFRISQKMNQIISGYKKKNKSGVNITYLSDKPSFLDLKDGSRQMGMFEEKRLLVGKNILQKSDIKKELEDNLDQIIDGENILILREDKEVKGRIIKELEKRDKTKAMIQKFDKLEGGNLKSWYKKELMKYDINFEKRVIAKLVDYIGDNLWRAKNEIHKLAHMTMGEELTVDHVTRFVRSEFDTNIFNTIDSLGRGEKGRALELVEKHMKDGDSPFYILSMINYQIRNLLTISQLESKGLSGKKLKKESRMSPFVFRKTKKQVKKFNYNELKKIHNELFKVDLDCKIGKITPEIGLMLVIFRF